MKEYTPHHLPDVTGDPLEISPDLSATEWERTTAQREQAVAAEIYDEFYNCLPPYSLPRDLRRDGHKGFLMGEPHSSDAQGLLYMAFVRHGLRHYYYGLVHR